MKPSRAALILRIPPSLHQRLKQEARSADISLNQHCRALLSRRERDTPAGRTRASVALVAGRSGSVASLGELVTAVLEIWGSDIEGLVLFGSIARGRQTAGSDIDLLVVLDRSVTLDRDVYSRWRHPQFAGREVAPLFVRIPGKDERIGGLWFEVAIDGIVLYDRDLQLSHFLSHVRELVALGRVRRRVTHGHPYWVHSGAAGEDPAPMGGS